MRDDRLREFAFFRGRVALHAILKALDVGEGDEVAIQAFTCLAVPEAVLAAGAKPVYVDIDAGYNMAPDDLANKLTSRTRAVVVQHTFGIPASMAELTAVAEGAGIPVIEDCCHTFHSKYGGRRTGTFGVASFYSFEWGKPVVVGVGGSARVNDDRVCERLASSYPSYGNPGMARRLKIELQYWGFGLLYRPRLYWPVRSLFRTLSKFGAAEGNFNEIDENGGIAEDFSMRMPRNLQRRLHAKLQRVDEHAQHSRRVAEEYRLRIDSPEVVHPVSPVESDPVYARYPLRVADKSRALAHARERNAELADWYNSPVHPLGRDELCRIGYEPESCPNAEARATEVVSLPTHGRVGPRDIDRIVNVFCGGER